MQLSTSVNQTMSMGKVGHVYILSDKKRGLLKIGRSINPMSRLSHLRSISGIYDSAEFVSHRVADCFRLESDMHKIFSACRVAGEWFRCDFDDAVSNLKQICPPEFSTDEIRVARRFDKEKGDKIFNAIQSHKSNVMSHSISCSFLSSISNIEVVYAFGNSMLHVYGALSDFIPQFSESHKLMVEAREHLEKSIDLLSKVLVEINSADNGLSVEDREVQVSILKEMIDSFTPSDEQSMNFAGNGSSWASHQIQEHSA